ncbi:MAG: helix-turn-helix domain-containing protein [Ruminococcus sp.]|nr:helix-turn-helix domain-containing protein [Ruminococcus sp.]
MIKFNIKMLRLLNNNMTAKRLQELSGIRCNTLVEYEYSRAKTISIQHLNTLCKIF